jgi:hypothetical protein
VPVTIIPKSFLKCCFSNAEDGTQDDMFWDDIEQSGKGASSSENECTTEGSLDEQIERNVRVVEILNFHFILVYFSLLFILNVF